MNNAGWLFSPTPLAIYFLAFLGGWGWARAGLKPETFLLTFLDTFKYAYFSSSEFFSPVESPFPFPLCVARPGG